MTAPLKIGALFAGYGGLDLAVESVLHSRVAWLSEFDSGPSKILAARYPDAPNLGDVTKIDWASVEPVDIITGGSPCQDLSHAGKRAGMKAGTRSGLWASMCDAIDIIRPGLVVWENVRGALSAEAAAGDVESCEFCVGDPGEPPLRALGRVLGDLSELGYDTAWCGLRAADVGAPHGRWRIFVLAWPADLADASGSRLRQHTGEPPAKEAGPGGRDLATGARGLRVARDGRQTPLAWGSREWHELNLLPTPVVNDMGRAYTPDTWDEWTARLKASHGNGNGHGASLSIEVLRLLPSPRTSDTKGGPNQRGSSGDLMLPSAVCLLPTPEASDGSGGRVSAERGGVRASGAKRAVTLATAVAHDLPRLLPTPMTTDGGSNSPADQARRSPGLRALPALLDEPLLLKTPTSQLAVNGGSQHPDKRKAGGHGPTLADEVEHLLPTPTAADHKASGSAGYARSATHNTGTTLTDATVRQSERFGQYAPAIERWEAVLGRSAPSPTEPTGKGGAHRLSPRFVEWLMGLPDGWVTDVDIPRNAQLKALGNGVVPQQAAAALRHLLTLREPA